MRSRLPAIVAIALLVGLAVPAVAGARSAQSEHDRILAYWTPQRIANAQPRDFQMNASGHIVPAARPGGGGTGASWTGDGAIEQRSGRVLFHMGTGDWICSASVLDDGNANDAYSLVLTAGHCAFDGTDGWASNWMYIPDFDDAPTYTCPNTVYGCWTARALALSAGFVNGGGFGNDTLTYDWSIAVVGPGGKSGASQVDALGSYALKTSGNNIGNTVWAFGYPAAGKYHGKDLTYCTGTTVADPYGAATWGLPCDMTGGSSGGPWLSGTTNPADGTGTVASLNSYGYSGLKYMFGPRFNTNTQNVFNAANQATPDATGTDHIVVN
jgi:V8-like Glu-specific endopeptidase